MSINSLANAAAGRRPDLAPLGEIPKGITEIAIAAITSPTAGSPPLEEFVAAGATASESGGIHFGRIDGGDASPKRARDAGAGSKAGGGSKLAGPSNQIDTTFNVLFGYIPTEVLTLYVAVMAAVQKEGKVTTADWIAFWIFLFATPVIFWLVFGAKLKSAQKPLPLKFSTWPLWEMFAATLAYVAWAFALPHSPFTEYSWYSSSLSGLAVLVVSTLLGLLAPFFQRPLGH